MITGGGFSSVSKCSLFFW